MILKADMLLALERLRALKKSSSQIGTNAREAVRFLDRETSGRTNIARVILQGPDECFDTWDAVQGFFLPEFEEEIRDGEHHVAENNETGQHLHGKLDFLRNGHNGIHDASGSTTSRSTETTSSSQPSTPERRIPIETQGMGEPSPIFAPPPVPEFLKSLLNSALWKLHRSESSSPVNSHFLITNDWEIQNWAVKYGISVKNIHQLRTAILYEDKEVKNHTKYMEKTQNAVDHPVPTTAPTTKPVGIASDVSETEEVTFVPRDQDKKCTAQSAGGRKGHHRKNNPFQNSAGLGTMHPVLNTAPSKDTVVEIPSAPIDPDSFDRNICVAGPVLPDTDINEWPALINPPSSTRGGRGRPGFVRGAMRGGGRGSRGKLWVP